MTHKPNHRVRRIFGRLRSYAQATARKVDIEERGASKFEHRGCLDKKTYVTRREAKQKAKKLTSEFGREMSFYRCVHCELFHITKAENHYRKRSAAG